MLAATMALPPGTPAQTGMEAAPPASPIQAAAVPPPQLATGVAHALRINAGDLLDVSVFDTPELIGKMRVNEIRGGAMVPIAGAVQACRHDIG